jgi:YbbR domain-containing protein
MNGVGPLSLDRLRKAARLVATSLRLLLTHNPGLKLLSIVIAVALWSFVNVGERDAEEPLQVPLELRNIPANLVITSPRLDFIDLRVIGPRTLLGRIDRSRLSMSLDLDGVRPGPAVFRVGPESFNLPRGVRVTRINPSQITLQLERLGRRSVPVRLQLSGELGEDFRLVEATVTPEAIEVSGPASDLREVPDVVTEKLDISSARTGTLERELGLTPIGEYLTYSVKSVTARARIEDVVLERSFAAVPVTVGNLTDGQRVVPQTLTVNVRGPRRLVRLLQLEAQNVAVDAGEVPESGGLVTPTVQLPEEVELVSLEPTQLRIEPLPPATEPAVTETPAAALTTTPGTEATTTPEAEVTPAAESEPG